MSEAQTILLIEDNPGDARLIREMLAEQGGGAFRVEAVDRLSRGLDYLRTGAACCWTCRSRTASA